MEKQRILTGTEAIALMRRFSREFRTSFELHHLTWDEDLQEAHGMRIVKRCQLRQSMRSDTFPRASAELFQAYIDLDLPQGNQNRMCRKKLIRYVAFPPSNELLKVCWFK